MAVAEQGPETTGRSLAEEILVYLLEHQEAQDTLEGIADWWVLERCIRRRVAEVEGALRELTQRGLVVERLGPDDSVRYQINRQKLAEIQTILAGVRSGSRPPTDLASEATPAGLGNKEKEDPK